jgi:hypothetical protein
MKPQTLTALDSELFTIPLATQALLPIHNLALNETDPPLVLDIPTLTRIWTGAYSTWDHSVNASHPHFSSFAVCSQRLLGSALVSAQDIASLNPELAAGGKLVGNITKVRYLGFSPVS